jgi:maleylpyruvate isomerase
MSTHTDPDLLHDLAVVRDGTAFFRRHLDRLPDDGLDAPSLLGGWSRRHVVAHVGYNAAALARLVTWAATGVETPMYPSVDARRDEIEHGATLRPEALRRLVQKTATELDLGWRDLPPEAWDAQVVTAQGRTVPAKETVWMRTREVWLHTVDLASGARIDQAPDAVLARLLDDVHTAWSRRPLERLPHLRVEDGTQVRTWGDPDTDGPTVRGRLPAMVAWATGRMPAPAREEELTWANGRPTAAPPWI